MSYYSIRIITNKARLYGNFLNDYKPHEEYYEFMKIGKPFKGFSNTPIIFERDNRHKNDEPISDFLLSDWSVLIVSQRVYDMLKEKYSSEIDFYECFARDEGVLKPYYILRPKYEIDVLDRTNSVMGGILGSAIKSVVIDNIPDTNNYFDIKDGAPRIISKKLYNDLMALNPTNFEVTPIATTSEMIASRERNRKKAEKKENINK